MRIAMLAPVSWPLPPPGYGPWERVASELTEELVQLGHDVTLFAAEGTETSAHLVVTIPHALELWPRLERERPRELDADTGLLEGPPDPRVLEELHIGRCMKEIVSGEFDLVHSHLHVHALPFAPLLPCPLVTTLHGSAWVRAAHPVLHAYRDNPFVSLSKAEREFLPELNYVATVPNGVSLDEFPLSRNREDSLLFAGRIAPEKGPDLAIEVAKRAGRRLLLAGVLEPQYQAFFDERVKPHLTAGVVDYVGPLERQDLAALYRRVAAVLFMNRWAEPFGLVAAEAQASGTPVIATNLGALREILVHGRTGFLVDSVQDAAAAVSRLDEISPDSCRQNVADHFTIRRMAERYASVYRGVLKTAARSLVTA